jgi:hypothetical protein
VAVCGGGDGLGVPLARFDVRRASSDQTVDMPVALSVPSDPLRHDYAALDFVAKGSYRYRIEAIDSRGSIAETAVAEVVVGEEQTGYELLVSPNPFNGVASVAILLDGVARVSVGVFDVHGRHVANLADRELDAGFHRLTWAGQDDRGRRVGAGLYFVRCVFRSEDGSSASRWARLSVVR